jgi:hypothetical protein
VFTKALTIVVSAALTAVFLAPAPASAASPHLTGRAAMRDCTSLDLTGCRPTGSWAAGTKVTMICWFDDSVATGRYKSNRWVYVVAGTRKGFAHSSWIAGRVATPYCGNNKGVMASRWAAMHIGSAAPDDSEAVWLGIGNGMWSGWPAAFAWGAYKLGARRTPKFNRKASARLDAYTTAGLGRAWTGAEPNIGSMVFWPNVGLPDGHTAIYVGNGYVVSTRGNGDPAAEVARVKTGTWGTPTGWVAAFDV